MRYEVISRAMTSVELAMPFNMDGMETPMIQVVATEVQDFVDFTFYDDVKSVRYDGRITLDAGVGLVLTEEPWLK